MTRLLPAALVVFFLCLWGALAGDPPPLESRIERGMKIDELEHRTRMGLWDVGFEGAVLFTPGVPGDEPTDSDGSLHEEFAGESPFVEGPQLTIASLRKENRELKAVVAGLASRVATLERRLSRIEGGDHQFVSETRFPNACPRGTSSLFQVERGMQIDALQHNMRLLRAMPWKR